MTDTQIQLERVSPGNWRDVVDLKVRPDQERFVAPVVRYLALCAYGYLGWKANAIKLGDEYVGFVMSGIEDEDNSFWVGGFVIDENHQRYGYGRAAMGSSSKRVRAWDAPRWR